MKLIYYYFDLRTHKGIRRKQILYACAYLASFRLRIPLIPIQIARSLDLDKRKISGADCYINIGKAKGLFDSIIEFSPLDFILLYPGDKKQYEILYNKFISENEKYKTYSPILVAGGFLYSINESKKDISEFFGISDTELRKLTKNISKM